MMSHVWMIPPSDPESLLFWRRGLSICLKKNWALRIILPWKVLSQFQRSKAFFFLLVLNVGNGWVAGGCWGLLGWLSLVIMDHSLKFPAFSEGHAGSAQISAPTQPFGAKKRIKDDRHTQYIPVQIGPEGLGAPFCSYRTASPRCPSYKLAEPNVHRGRFLLQNGSPSWPLVTKCVTDFARLASARIRWLDLPFTEWWGLGVAILALSYRIPGK